MRERKVRVHTNTNRQIDRRQTQLANITRPISNFIHHKVEKEKHKYIQHT